MTSRAKNRLKYLVGVALGLLSGLLLGSLSWPELAAQFVRALSSSRPS